jgi:F0F1-type ATP synthase assembly protein I
VQLALSVVVFLLVGRWADGHWGIAPWGTVCGLIAGATGGFIKFIRTAMALGRQADEEARRSKTEGR